MKEKKENNIVDSIPDKILIRNSASFGGDCTY